MQIIPATALEVVYDWIRLDPGTIAVGGTTTMYNADPDQQGLVREIMEADGQPYLTMGTIVALEMTQISIGIRGEPGKYKAVRDEAMRLRYLVGSMKEYTSRGITVHAALPVGNMRPMGQDAQEREQFELLFNVYAEPSYVQE